MRRISTNRRPVLTAAAAAFALAALAGCARTRPIAQPPAPPPTVTREQAAAAALDRLERLARAQDERPLPDAAAPPPPGLDPALTTPLAADPERAGMPLDEAIALFAQRRPEGQTEVSPVDPEAAESALRHYIAGRQKAMEGDPAGALTDLRTATTLDPNAGEPWRELGEVQLATGARAEAAVSFQNAAARGLEDPRVLELLGRFALERADTEQAAIYLARAALASPAKADPLLPHVIDAALWRALSAQGYVTAARDALRRSVERPVELSASSRYGNEYNALFRRQGDLWREIGDTECRLGRFEEAAAAYERAAELPSLEGHDLLTRRTFALVRAGRPAGAAVVVLREIMDADGRATPEAVGLLRYLDRVSRHGPDIANALGLFRISVPQPPSVAGGLARAQAAVAGNDRARTILREQLLAHPGDLQSAKDLFNVAGSPAQAAAEAVRIARTHPGDAGRLAEALLLSDEPIEEIMAALDRALPRDTAQLILAYIESARGDATRAAERAAAIQPRPDTAPAAALACVELGLLAGRADLADQAIRALMAGQGLEWARYRARALAWVQRGSDAMGWLRQVLEQPATIADHRLDDLLVAADLAIALERPDEAESYIAAAAALDPFDGRHAARILTLSGPGGLKPDPERVNQVVRDLRDNIPESRALRAARAKEMMRRSLLPQAEEEAVRLLQEDPSDGGLVDLTEEIFEARAEAGDEGAVQRGRELYEKLLAERPRSRALLKGLTSMLLKAGETAQAELRLRTALRHGGGPDVSRLLEELLREHLHREEEAMAIALARLERPGRTIIESLELANLCAHEDRPADALKALTDAFPPGTLLTPDQKARALGVVAQAADRVAARADDERLAAAAGLFDLIVGQKIPLPPEMHQRRLALLARWSGATVPMIAQAAADAAREVPSGEGAAYAVAANFLAQADRPKAALEVMRLGVESVQNPDVVLFRAWCALVATSGTAADARAIADKAEQAERLDELVPYLVGAESMPAPGNWKAEFFYIMGNYFSVANRTEEANAAYEIALEHDPNHPWACNNLGYWLADKGIEIERASQLLERAHAALPNEAAITDSLGWLRYKQGILEDEIDPATGAVRRQGALSLLRAAAETDHGMTDPTILDHYGDALWLAGRAAEAARMWTRAERLASKLAAEAETSEAAGVSSREVQEYRAIRASAAAKRRAAAAGQDVPVAPQLGNPRPRPAADAPATAPAGSAAASGPQPPQP